MRFCDGHHCTTLPHTALPATVENARSLLVLTGYGLISPPSIKTSPPDLRATITALPDSARWAVQDFQARDNGRHIAQSIREGTCIAVSDGSYKDNQGTAFWIIEGMDLSYKLQGALDIPGHTTENSGMSHGTCGIIATKSCTNPTQVSIQYYYIKTFAERCNSVQRAFLQMPRSFSAKEEPSSTLLRIWEERGSNASERLANSLPDPDTATPAVADS